MALIAESKSFYAEDDDNTSNVSLTSSVWGSEAPKTHFLFGMNNNLTSVFTDIQNSIGWSDGTDNVAIGNGSQNGQGTSICNRTHQTAYTAYPLKSKMEGFTKGLYKVLIMQVHQVLVILGVVRLMMVIDIFFGL
jgi:hypothetical protein